MKGDLRLGFMITKGQLEIDVICAKGLIRQKTQLSLGGFNAYDVVSTNIEIELFS